MIVVAAGDSFVYGSELSDCLDKHDVGNHRYGSSKLTFTGLLARDNEYVCLAWPGYGNDSIARTVISYCEEFKSQDTLILVSWTFPGRYEFRFSYCTQQKHSPWFTITPWTTKNNPYEIKEQFESANEEILIAHVLANKRAKKTGVAEFAESFYKHVGESEYWEIYSTLKEIVYLQNYLKLKQIPYLFTCADNSIFYNHTVRTTDLTISSLVKQIDVENWFWFPAGINPQDTQNPRGFYQWAVENKYPIGTTHPLEEAHQDAAQLMQGKFNELVKKHLG